MLAASSNKGSHACTSKAGMASQDTIRMHRENSTKETYKCHFKAIKHVLHIEWTIKLFKIIYLR